MAKNQWGEVLNISNIDQRQLLIQQVHIGNDPNFYEMNGSIRLTAATLKGLAEVISAPTEKRQRFSRSYRLWGKIILKFGKRT